jgi:cobalamin biosynthetic protein CobC
MSAPIAHGGGITAAAAAFGGTPQDWLDLSTGINPCPVALPEIPARAWHRLPDSYLVDEARRAARNYYGSGEILPLPVPGTQSVIQLLPRLLRQESQVAVTDDKVAVVSPTYGEYVRAFASAGFAVDAVDDIAAVGVDHRLAVVVNPNNPDGRVWSADSISASPCWSMASPAVMRRPPLSTCPTRPPAMPKPTMRARVRSRSAR